MNTKLQIEQEIAELARKLESSKKALEEFNQNDVSGCKPGDYVVCIGDYSCGRKLNSGQIYIIERFPLENTGRIFIQNFEDSFYTSRFRKATIPEIDAHLINEAGKLGFIVGAKILELGSIHTIDHIDVYRGGAHPRKINGKRIPISTHQEYNLSGKPVVFASYGDDNFAQPVSKLKLVPNLPDIKIEVESKVYIAEFHPGYVQFGCAKIDNLMFIEAHRFINVPLEPLSPGNKRVNAIQIGKGLFSTELITEIAARIKEGK